MEILIHDERPDEPKLLPHGIVSKVSKTDVREDGTKLIDMVSGERYSVVLTNDRYEEEVDLGGFKNDLRIFICEENH